MAAGEITTGTSSRKWRTAAAAAVALSIALTGLGSSPAGDRARAAGRYSKHRNIVNAGLTLLKMYDSRLHAVIRVLKVDPSTFVTLDVALSNNILPMRETTSSMVARHHAIAGINASFGTSWGRPLGMFAEDGTLMASPIMPGGGLAFSKGEKTGNIGHKPLQVSVLNNNNGATWRIPDWNDSSPNLGRVSAYTSAGGSVVDPPGDSCSMRIVPVGPRRWSGDLKKLRQRYRVRKQVCQDAPLGLAEGLVLASRRGTKGAQKIQRNNRGQYVRLSWSVGYPKAMDAVGGSPVLINNGDMIDRCTGYVCERHPRTGVGRLPNGKVLLVTVDGRQSDSYGMTGLQFARFFKHMGATDAINMDGGGSSTMVLRGNIVNDPSDAGGERAVSSAIIVHAGPDSDEPSPEFTKTTSTASSPTAAEEEASEESARLSMEDPASTGGLLDALARGGFGDPRVNLSGELERALKRFRRTRR
jgi:uncharacterized protein YigE (DUF2233 family)